MGRWEVGTMGICKIPSVHTLCKPIQAKSRVQDKEFSSSGHQIEVLKLSLEL